MLSSVTLAPVKLIFLQVDLSSNTDNTMYFDDPSFISVHFRSHFTSELIVHCLKLLRKILYSQFVPFPFSSGPHSDNISTLKSPVCCLLITFEILHPYFACRSLPSREVPETPLEKKAWIVTLFSILSWLRTMLVTRDSQKS